MEALRSSVRSRAVALAVVVSVIGALATTVASVATAPAAGASGHDGTVFAWGPFAHFYGSPGMAPRAPLAGIVGTPDDRGYWVVRADGGVYHSGSAGWFGDARPLHPAPVVGMAPTPSGNGYWVAASDGGVYAFGDAHFYGSAYSYLGGSTIVAIAPSKSGKGYWLIAANGGVFTFGDAPFFGSAYGYLGGSTLTSIAATASGRGYWTTAANGGVFTFGDARFYGSPYGRTRGPLVSIARSAGGNGYVMLDQVGHAFMFGDAITCSSITPYVSFLRRAVSVAVTHHHTGCWVLADNVPANGVVAAPGTTGTAAVAVQAALLARGFWLSPDGVYDTLTQQAVYAFQKATGRARTGIVTGADWRALLGFRRVTPRTPTGQVVEVDLARQLLIFANNGVAQWVVNTSTGSGQPYSWGGHNYVAVTPTGHFTIIRQVDGLDISHLGQLWRPKYFTWDGIAIHGSASIPPYPASHGCVRVSDSAMDFFWANNMLPIGAAVDVY